jgi:hypothetical protein
LLTAAPRLAAFNFFSILPHIYVHFSPTIMRLSVVPLIITVAYCFCNLRLAAQNPPLSANRRAVKYDLFNRPTLGEIQINAPQPFQFTPVTLNAAPAMGQPGLPNINPIFADNAIEEQNRRILQQHSMLPGQITTPQQVKQLADIERDLMEEKFYREHIEWSNKTAIYRQAFGMLNQLNPDNFSITNAVFIVENAFLDNKFPYKEFFKALELRADHVKQILKRENLDSKNNIALNYGIQKLYAGSNAYYNPTTKQTVTVPPFKYDFNDFRGEQDYTKMFTIKLLGTGKGQCHSMPLLYLMIAEQLGAKAWLSLAPQHSFIQFVDRNGNLMNFETTNGNLVSTHWLYQSGYINANALKERTYLDTLSQRQLYAQCMADLLLGYLKKFGYDDFAEQIRQRIMQLNPNNMTALIVDTETKKRVAMQKILAAGKPPEEKLSQYPEAYQAFLAMQDAFDRVDALGYQDMPKEAYQAWLKSIEQEKKKQEQRELKEKMSREIEGLRNTKQTFVNKSKH